MSELQNRFDEEDAGGEGDQQEEPEDFVSYVTVSV